MAGLKYAVVFVLCSVLTSSLCQVPQGGPHEPQGGAHVTQGVPHEPHGGAHVTQGVPHEPQGGAHVTQGGPHVSQGGPHVSQGGPQQNQGRVRRQATQGGPHESQGGPHVTQSGPHESQGGPHENQGRVRRQAEQGANKGPPVWTSCDFTTVSKISCHDCNTRLICKKLGGILKPCGPKRPFCSNGVCSIEPIPECV